jgi:hypothetical protein
MAKWIQAAGLALPVAILAAYAGPAYTGLRDKPAGEPFAYAIPEGFESLPASGAKPGTDRNVWVHASLGHGGLLPNVSITHANDMGVFDDAKLVHIASGMPAYFEGSGVQWKEVRHAQMKRRDGTLVGLLEGENTLGEERFRSLQLSFPDDRGVSLVTANFPSFEAAHWGPIFEATIETSRGVATRGVMTPLWVFLAWGGGGGLVAFGLLALLGGGVSQPVTHGNSPRAEEASRRPEEASPAASEKTSPPGPLSAGGEGESSVTK